VTTALNGIISDGRGNRSLTLAGGGGIFILSGNNSHSGGTRINSGTLRIGHASALGTGTFTLNFNEDMDHTSFSAADFDNAGTSSLTLGAITEISPGVFTVTATPTTAGTLQFQVNQGGVLKDLAGINLITAAGGNIHVIAAEFKATDIPPNAYEVWAAQYPTADLTDPYAEIDKGGLPIGIEWVVGGDPTNSGDDAGKTPTFSNSDPDYFVFSYRRRDAANTDVKTTITAQYGANIGTWTNAIHGVSGVTINDSTVPEAGFRTVMVSIPKTLSASGRLFARLRVVVANP
jgi:autotransporter-associated beta strand protein